MKKVLAIGLASAMMTCTAFATTAGLNTQNFEPGEKITFKMADFKDLNSLYVKQTGTGFDSLSAPIEPDKFVITTDDKGDTTNFKKVSYYSSINYLGAPWNKTTVYTDSTGNKPELTSNFGLKANGTGLDKAKLAIDKLARQNIQPYDFTAQNFRVNLTATVGRNLIKSTTFDGAGNLIITLKEDFRLPGKAGPDLVVTDLSVTSVRNIRDIQDGGIVLYAGRTFTADLSQAGDKPLNKEGTINTVGVTVQDTPLTSGIDEVLNADGTWVRYTDQAGAYRAVARFEDPATGVIVKGTVYSGDVVSFKYGEAPNDAVIRILQNNPNANVDIYSIVAKGFKSGFTVSIPANSVYGASADANGVVEVLSAVVNNRNNIYNGYSNNNNNNNKRIYIVSNTGVLTAAPFSYNAATGSWEGKLPATGGTILVSDMALQGVTAGSGNTGGTNQNTNPNKNPSTGFGIDFGGAIVG